jgi:glycosyltransferase involved in cell wall biosynthesis
MPKVSIFIRTYKRDVAWLDFCLQSIQRNLKGWDEIVVCVPAGQERHARHVEGARVVTSPVFAEDYVGQQFAKLQAHLHVRGDYVLFVDSDVVFLPGADVGDFLDGERPIVGKWRYASMIAAGEGGAKWQAAVARLFGETPEWDYMRGHGARLYHVETLRAFARRFPDLEAYARSVDRRQFSEFNFLGFFAEKHEADRYRFRDVEREALPPQVSRQFWTVDGITEETLAELAGLGFSPRWPSTLSFLDRAKAWLSQTTRRIKRRLKARKAA